MKKYIYGFGTLAITLAMSGLPAIVSAEEGRGEQSEVRVQATVQVQGASASTTARVDDDDDDRVTNLSSLSNREIKDSDDDDGIEIELEDDSDRAVSLADLRQKIEDRRHELDDEEASTTPDRKDIMRNANPVRLAVHTLLASKDLLGGIGPKVSEIAKGMNDSVATTTDAEAKMQSRGFLTRFLFGGDAAAANIIKDEVAKNQARIDDLDKMLAETNVSADIQVTLKAQIAAFTDAQTRLQALAEKERGMWGLFSWRF